jgi:hypothetical protein
MSRAPEFEILAGKFNLDLNHNGLNYMNHQTAMCFDFWQAQQVKINKLQHDMANEHAAAQIWEASYKALTLKNAQREVSA